MNITSLEELVHFLVKHPPIHRDSKLAEKLSFSFIPKRRDSYECIAVINSKQPTAELHPTFSMHFSVKCVILTTPWLLKETPISTTWQAVNKASHSFPLICSLSMHRILSCGRFFVHFVRCTIGLCGVSREKIHASFLHFVSWNSAVINCLSTVVITETSEGHMGCNRPLLPVRQRN